ncbi:MAG: response regulator [Anaerolineae bacterium]|nr:response regulator [Anaerolineae bacterium]
MMTIDNHSQPFDIRESDRRTRHLDKYDHTEEMPIRATGPLDSVLPWVLEFRVMGTSSVIQVRVSEYMTIGRSDPEKGVEPHINLTSYGGHVLGVSRQHSVILATDDRISIRDVGSSNGTRLNGYALVPHQDYRLRHGDELAFGQLQVQVFFAVVPLVSASKVDSGALSAKLGNGQRVLVVEDDTDVASVFSMILEQIGFNVTTVNRAAAAVSFINQKMPDAIMLDLMLPDMDGLDLVRYVRTLELETQTRIPIIVASGITGGYQMNLALNTGADIFLGKPLGVDELVGTFATLMPQMA